MHKSAYHAFVLALAAACAAAHASPMADAKEFQCVAVPSKWKEPGSIFSVNAEGTSFRVGKVDAIKPLPESPVGFPAFESETTLGAGLLVSTLESLAKVTGWSAQVNATASEQVKIKSKYEGVKLEITEGQPDQQAIEWFKAKRLKVASRTRYFLVREAIKATSVDYEIKRGDIEKIGGEAKIKMVGEGKLNLIDRQNSNSYALKIKFDEPVNVCIKTQELVAVSLSASGEQNLGFRKVTAPIEIKAVKE